MTSRGHTSPTGLPGFSVDKLFLPVTRSAKKQKNAETKKARTHFYVRG
jgi:hypothetical protein